jgi:hypothetical protein
MRYLLSRRGQTRKGKCCCKVVKSLPYQLPTDKYKYIAACYLTRARIPCPTT